MVQINEKVADFTAKAFHEDQEKTLKLSDYKGKWVVLAFYPADFTFICPTELAELAHLHEQFRKEGAEILSISTDSVEVHKAWHDHSPSIKTIKYPMIADTSGRISRYFGTYNEEEGQSWRASFIINPDGVLKWMEIHDNDIGRSGEEILRKLQAAHFVRENKGLVCPASWRPGSKTIKKGLDLVGKI